MSSLAHGQPGEVPQLHQPRCLWVCDRQAGQGRIQLNNVMAGIRRGEGGIVESDASAAAPMFPPPLSPGCIDQNPPHGLGCRRKEMPSALLALGSIDIDQPHIGLVNESRRL